MPTLQALKPEIKEYQISSPNEIELDGVKYRNEFGLWVPRSALNLPLDSNYHPCC